jgi:hypothetical protein
MSEGDDRVGFTGHVRDAQAHDGTHVALASLERRGAWTSDGRRERRHDQHHNTFNGGPLDPVGSATSA